MSTLTNKQDWEKEIKIGVTEEKMFSEIFELYFYPDNQKVMLEIGCVPGGFLAYFSKKYHYSVEGIDYISGTNEILESTFEKNKVKRYKIY